MSTTTWQKWTHLSDLHADKLVSMRGREGELYVLARKVPDKTIHLARQTGANPMMWSEWTNLEWSWPHLFSATLGADDRVHFCRDWPASAKIHYIRENAPGALSFDYRRKWEHHKPIEMLLTTLADGRIILLYVTRSHAVKLCQLTGPGSIDLVGAWTDLGNWVQSLTVAHGWDGLHIFGVAADGTLQHAAETPDGGWGSWSNLGGALRKVAAASHDGRLYVYAVGRDESLWSRSYDGAELNWGPWRRHGNRIREVDVAVDEAGRPIVVALGINGRLYSFQPGHRTPEVAEVVQGEAMRVSVNGLGMDRVTRIEMKPSGHRAGSVYEPTEDARRSESVCFSVPAETTVRLPPGHLAYRVRLTDAANHMSPWIDSAVHIAPDAETPILSSVTFQSSESEPNTWRQGESVTLLMGGVNLSDASDVLLADGVSFFAGMDPLDPTSDAYFIDRSGDRVLAIGLRPAWTRARPPGPIQFLLNVVGRGGQYSAAIHASATVLAADETPTMTQMTIRPSGADPESPPNTWTQGEDLIIELEGEHLADVGDILGPDGASLLVDSDVAIRAEQSHDQHLEIAMGAACTRRHMPGPQSFTLAVVGADGLRSAPISQSVQVEPAAGHTPQIDAILAMPARGGARNTWTQADAVKLTIEGSNLQGVSAVLDGEGRDMLDEHTVIVPEESDNTTLVIEMAPECTARHEPGQQNLTLTVVRDTGHRSNHYSAQVYVCLRAEAPRVRSVAEAAVSSSP